MVSSILEHTTTRGTKGGGKTRGYNTLYFNLKIRQNKHVNMCHRITPIKQRGFVLCVDMDERGWKKGE